jgi:hypothetical protein
MRGLIACTGDEQVNDVQLVSVDNDSGFAVFDIIQATADEVETLIAQFLNGRVKIDLPGEPGFDLMLIADLDVGQAAGLQPAYVSCDDAIGDCVPDVAGSNHHGEAGR